MPTAVTWNQTGYNVPNAGELNWSALASFLVDLGNNAQTTNFQRFGARIATTTPIAPTATDCIITSDLTVAGAVAVNLTAGTAGRVLCLIDGKGDAGTNNITITPNGAETINGAANYVISKNNAGIFLVYDGVSNWIVVAEFADAQGTAALLNSHIAATGAHGVTVVVGTTETQTLSNKNLTAATNTFDLSDGDINASAAIAATKLADGSVDNAEFQRLNGVTSDIQTQLDSKIPNAEKGAANGVAELDGSGTVPTSQLPAAVLGAIQYQGAWNATTNTPALASGVGTQGHYYTVNVAGSTNLDGITDWQIGDNAVFNGTVWEKIDNTDLVTSVAGKQGIVTLDLSDVDNGGALVSPNISESLLLDVQGVAPANPAAGKIKLYPKADGLYRLDSAGTETKIADIVLTTKGDILSHDGSNPVRLPVGTAGQRLTPDAAEATGLKWVADSGGQGEVNYIKNPNAADNLDDINDVGAGTTSSRTTTVSEIPRSSIHEAAIKINNDGAGTDYTEIEADLIGDPDLGVINKIQFHYLAGSTVSTGDFTVTLYGYDDASYSVNETQYQLNGSTDPVELFGSSGRFLSTFVPDESQAYYKIRINRAAGSNAATDFISLNDVILGPGLITQGRGKTSARSFTGVLNNDTGLTATTNVFEYFRDGEYLIIIGRVNFTGTGTDGGNLSLDLPVSNITIDNSINNHGDAQLTYTGQGVNTGRLKRESDTRIFIEGQVGGSSTVRSLNGSDFGNTGNLIQGIQINAKIPITQWRGSGIQNTVSENNVTRWRDQSATPTNWSTNIEFQTQKYKRVGYEFYARGALELSGVNATDGSIELSIESGLTIDPDQFITGFTSTSRDAITIGKWKIWDNNLNDVHFGPVVYNLDTGTINCQQTNGALNTFVNAASNSPITFADGDIMTWEFSVQVLQYANQPSPLVGFAGADVDRAGLVKATKWQRRILSGPDKVNGDPNLLDNPDLRFSNLTIGKTYRVTGQAFIVSVDGGDVAMNILNNGVTYGRLLRDSNEATDDVEIIAGIVPAIFTATATTVVTNLIIPAGSTIRANGTISETWVQLEELDSYIETTDFT